MNPYEILGVRPDAGAEAIHARYRQLAKSKHPDAGGDAAEFAKISLAHEVLTDPERRAKYDRTGIVDGAPDNDLAQAMTVLNEAFEKVVGNLMDPERHDIVRSIRDYIEGKRQEIAAKRRVCDGVKTKLQRIAGRFIATGTTANLLDDIRRAKLAQCDEALANLARIEKPLSDALELLKDQRFQWDESSPPAYQPRWGGGGLGAMNTSSGYRPPRW